MITVVRIPLSLDISPSDAPRSDTSEATAGAGAERFHVRQDGAGMVNETFH